MASFPGSDVLKGQQGANGDVMRAASRKTQMFYRPLPPSTLRTFGRTNPRAFGGSTRLKCTAPTDCEPLVSRRLLNAAGAAALSSLCVTGTAKSSSASEVDTTITHKVFLDVGVASRGVKKAEDRTLGDKSIIPTDAAPIGRIVIGLYGQVVPTTVKNFLQVVESGKLVGTTFSRVLPGEYIMAGKQGQKRLGELDSSTQLEVNRDVADPRAFKLTHYRPGTVSLALTENDEDDYVRTQPGYTSVEFLITTGPGPVPRLDDGNLVFGQVLEGQQVVSAISKVPSFKPSINEQQLNRFASFIGDSRAETVRRKYGKPLKAVVILDSGVIAEPVERGERQG